MDGIKNKIVLILDDDEDFVLLISQILNRMGLIVHTSDTILSALSIIDSQIPHLIILDINLYRKSGLQLLKLRENNPILKDIPVLIASSSSETIRLIKDMNLSIDDHIRKPLKPFLLQEKVKRIVKNNPGQSYKFSSIETPKIKVKVNGTITKVNEVSCIFESPVKFSPFKILPIKSLFLKKYELQDLPLRTLGESNLKRSKCFETKLIILGIIEKYAQQIRKIKI